MDGVVSAADKLEVRLRALRATGRKQVAASVTAGDGGRDVTLALLRELADLDVPCVELALPSHVPLGESAPLRAANERALAAGTTFEELLELLSALRRGGRGELGRDLPVVVTSSASALVQRGWGNAVRALARAGADALRITDLAVEDAGPMASAARMCGIAPVFFVAAVTPDARLDSAVKMSRGFVYAAVSHGATDAHGELDESARSFLGRVRRAAQSLPVAAGLGLSNAADVRAALQHADFAFVGSAFVDHVHHAVARAAPPRRVDAARVAAREFVQIVSSGLAA